MEETKPTPQAGETCLCRDAMRSFDRLFRIRSENARLHLRNSRIEFLKAIRSVIDDRIAHLSQSGQQGTKLSVE